MPRIDLPGDGIAVARALSLHPSYSDAWDVASRAVYVDTTLPWRMAEAVRYRISQVNGCLLCQSGRYRRGEAEGFTEDVYNEIATYQTSANFSDAEKMAIAFAERFAGDHHAIDDDFIQRLRTYLTDSEIVDLAFLTARHMATGRFTHVLGLDDHCDIDSRAWIDR